MPDALVLSNVSLGYGNRVVLEIPDLKVPAGGMICLIGPSGVGKSTLLEALGFMSNTFLHKPGVETEMWVGSDRFDPHALWAGPVAELAQMRRDKFSFIFQSTNLMPNFTIGENIRMGYQGEDEAVFEQRVQELLDHMHLPLDILDRATHELSGGQRQRVAFIRALAKDFSILLADEPTGNLDQQNALSLFGLLRSEVVRQGRTALVVTHHIGLAEEFGDIILEIQPGTDKSPAQVMPRKSRSLV